MELNVPRTRTDYSTGLRCWKLKDDNLKIAKNFKTSTPGKGKGKGKEKVKVKRQKQTDKKYKHGKGKEERKKKNLKDGESNTKKVNNKTYDWCLTHQAWTIHRPDECKLKADQAKSNHQPNQQRPNTKPLERALATISSDINNEEN